VKRMMNPWFKSVVVALIVSIVACAIPYVFSWKGESHLGNGGLILAAGVCVASLVPSLFLSWCWHRWVSRKKSFGAAALNAAALCLVAFSLISHPLLGIWFWKIAPVIGIFPAVFCGIPLIYLWLCRKPVEKESIPIAQTNREA
jgi:hypothetical protein